MHKPSTALITIFLQLLAFLSVYGQSGIKANPDNFSTGMSWTLEGIPSIKVGDDIEFKHFTIGAMIETRNEKRFNQEFFSNHNWRGVGLLKIRILNKSFDSSIIVVAAHVHHESAHPTMGIKESTQKAYELIYDDIYRRMILNSTGINGRYVYKFNRTSLTGELCYNFYFQSKNTPELTTPTLGFGNGISFSIEEKLFLNPKFHLYFSIYNRFIFKSSKTDTGKVYEGNDTTLTNNYHIYPVMNEVNTLVCKTGIIVPIQKREAGIYCSLLYGNSFGFIDSRDLRLILSIGFEISI
jgi:hypothetical protein